jgi:hypothetical protein
MKRAGVFVITKALIRGHIISFLLAGGTENAAKFHQ